MNVLGVLDVHVRHLVLLSAETIESGWDDAEESLVTLHCQIQMFRHHQALMNEYRADASVFDA